MNKGTYIEKLEKDYTYSYYLLDGELTIEDKLLKKDSFLVLEDLDYIEIIVNEKSELFFVKSPSKIGYKRFLQRY
ncbi:MAG: hypothetical protein COB17_09610 [Sulfurimonas sp.]|nr:MAG: hypothetical protein COB17_09610 [Sulfurimonas sp.]